MAKNAPTQKKSAKSGGGYTKLPFHSPKPTKADKKTISEKLNNGDLQIIHLDNIIGESDWLKIRYDSDNDMWLAMHTYTGDSHDEPIGIVSYRAKTISKAIALALWGLDEINDAVFLEDDDDDDF